MFKLFLTIIALIALTHSAPTTTTTKKHQTSPCLNHPTGKLLKDPLNEHKFIKCISEEEFQVEECPNDLLFVSKSESCEDVEHQDEKHVVKVKKSNKNAKSVTTNVEMSNEIEQTTEFTVPDLVEETTTVRTTSKAQEKNKKKSLNENKPVLVRFTDFDSTNTETTTPVDQQERLNSIEVNNEIAPTQSVEETTITEVPTTTTTTTRKVKTTTTTQSTTTVELELEETTRSRQTTKTTRNITTRSTTESVLNGDEQTTEVVFNAEESTTTVSTTKRSKTTTTTLETELDLNESTTVGQSDRVKKFKLLKKNTKRLNDKELLTEDTESF